MAIAAMRAWADTISGLSHGPHRLLGVILDYVNDELRVAWLWRPLAVSDRARFVPGTSAILPCSERLLMMVPFPETSRLAYAIRYRAVEFPGMRNAGT
jgi:hypothetical protein